METTEASTNVSDSGALRDYLSIGDVAEATGIAPDTIRIWERRYGRPKPVRLPSGHRRYTQEHVRWLRRVAEALARGHRPAMVMKLSEPEVDRLLEASTPRSAEHDLDLLIEHVRNYRSAELMENLLDAWKRLGPRDFVDRVCAPLIHRVGRDWADGNLDVRHEHFLSQVLEDLLRSLRISLGAKDERPTVVLATLTGELHGLGLQMAALIAAAANVGCRVLGVDTPNDQIRNALRETGARGLGLSVSLATGGVATDKAIRELLATLPDGVKVAVGGLGARGIRRGVPGVSYCEDFDSFVAWMQSL
ncbi:MAG: MerR family transcriptional regulator [Planctomycetes bacterium]|nr:MerR family transcriptional regulator [Planctomycetota bacterium]